MKKKKQKVVVILGPTASGKSDLAVSIAKRFNGEVISADSRQVYRGMDIGTGKMTKEEMRGVRHHLLDVTSPITQFNVAEYRRLAQKAIDDIGTRGKLPIVCGGTGLYIDSIFKDDPFPNIPPDESLRDRLSKKPADKLLLELKKIDLKRWQTISANPSERKNARRIVRAIEIARAMEKRSMERRPANTDHWQAGKERKTRQSQRYAETSPLQYQYAPFFIGVKVSKENLEKWIIARLMRRLRHGMLAEARRLHAHGLSWKRMEQFGLEYRYEARYLQGKISKKEFIDKLSMEIRRYAKRQMTWFKRNKAIEWFSPTEQQKIFARVANALSRNRLS